MARGDIKQFTAFEYRKSLGEINMSTDTFRWVFVTDQYANINANAASMDLSNFTQVASTGNYTANSIIANTGVVQSGNTVTLDGDDITYAADNANPTTPLCLLIYDDSTTPKYALALVDLTTDGVTAADTTQGFTFTVNANGIHVATVNPA